MSIEVNQVTYTYMPQTAFERTALSKITLTIEEGVLTAIAGHTGSGKSTLVQHLNGILHPTQGSVMVDGQDLAAKDKTAITARRRVGMVFQYPEHQLFEETVEEDIAFGPKNLGLSAEEIARRVRRAMELVGRRSPGSWRWNRNIWCWTSRRQALIRGGMMISCNGLSGSIGKRK